MSKSFPNCPELEEIVTDPTDSLFEGQHWWASICSRHMIVTHESCNMCQAGCWVLVDRDHARSARQRLYKANWFNGRYYGER